MNMEGLELMPEELDLIRKCRSGGLAGDEIRAQILSEAGINV